MENIIQFIHDNEWERAAEAVLEKLNNSEFNDILAILAATVNEHFGDDEMVFSFVLKGLEYNYKNYELYILLGNYYAKRNANQAYLCYENAEYFCEINGNKEDEEYISQIKDKFKKEHDVSIPSFSFVILSDDRIDVMKECIDSIRRNCKAYTYELVVVDNASTDGSREWLLSQKDITLICNDKNVAASIRYNQGIAAASRNNDIMLLNAATVMMPNTMFTLRLDLYNSDKNGVAECVSNYQLMETNLCEMSEYIKYSENNNLPDILCEYRPILNGDAMLIKRKVLDVIGGMDESFAVFEDIDLCMSGLSHGYRNIFCWNSFIYSGEKQRITDVTLMQKSRAVFMKKWGITPDYYGNIRTDLISMIEQSEDAIIHVLEVGCGMGATLGAIKYKYPNSYVYGIEVIESVAKLGNVNFDIICEDVEEAILPFEEEKFDYIIFGDVLEHLKYPEKVLNEMKRYLKPEGCVIASIPNLMNAETIYQLLHGFFPYEDSGIRDRTHLRFFTYYEIVNMLQRTGYQATKVMAKYCDGFTTNDFKEFFDKLLEIQGVTERKYFDVYQYLVCAKKL